MNKKEWARAQTKRLRDLAAAEQIRWHEPTPGHFKLGALNYWPSTGTYHLDGRARLGRRCSPEVAIELAKKQLGGARSELRLFDDGEGDLDFS